MKRMLFNATQAEELRVAIVDGQKLLDLDIEMQGKEQRKGNIYKGIITRIEPSLEACFVDYGAERHGFLPFKEVARSYFQNYEGGRVRIQDVLQEGQSVLVQVEKDERGNKGAALTTFIGLAGRYLVLMPNNPRGGGVSRRVDGEERQELKEALSQLDIPRGMSVIARTAGIGRAVEELQWDLSYLLQLWQAISDAAKQENVQHLILQESALVIRAIRDYFQPDIGEILIDTEDIYQKVYQFMSVVMPANLSRVKRYSESVPLFSRFQIEHQIETAFSREVPLPSGGAIVIDHTEALVAVDVNSAKSTRGTDVEETAFKTNLEAAEEVARQMRLRDLGGLIVIDFIDMENSKNQRQVENVFREAVKNDRARVQMGKLSRFGLMELSRQRLQLSLGESTHIACPRCFGTGFIRGIESSALHILRIIQEEAMKENTGEIQTQVPVDVATFLLNEKRAELLSLEENLSVPIILIPNSHLEVPHYHVERIRVDDVDDHAPPSYKQVKIPETEHFVHSSSKNTLPVETAAVQGVTPVSAAPVIVKKTGVFHRLGAWIKGLFSSEEPVKETPKKSKNQQRSHARKPQKRRRQSTQSVSENAQHKNNVVKNAEVKTLATKVTASDDVVPYIEPKQTKAKVEKAEPTTQPEKAVRKTVEKNKKVAKTEDVSAENKSAKTTRNHASKKVQETAPHQQKAVIINFGDDVKEAHSTTTHRRNSRNRYEIPRAEDIIKRIKLRAIVRHVQLTSQRILPLPAEASETVENLPAIAPTTSVIVSEPAPVPAVIPETAPQTVKVEETSSADLDLGGLQLVETNTTFTPAEHESEPVQNNVKRRSDVMQELAFEEPEQPITLQQIETQQQNG